MTTLRYGSSVIPSVIAEVETGEIVTGGVEGVVGIVGNMNVDEGTADPNEVYTVATRGNAETLFGEGSELERSYRLARQNGAEEVKITAVEELDGSEEFADADGGELEDAPIVDPNVEPEHGTFRDAYPDILDLSADQDIVVTDNADEEQSVKIVYGVSFEAPVEEDEEDIRLNPITGEWASDEVDTYTFEYVYGDYDTAIEEIVQEDARFFAVQQESVEVGEKLAEELEFRADEHYPDLAHGSVGTVPEVDANEYESEYDAVDEVFDSRRLVVNPTHRGYRDFDETEQVRLGAGFAGAVAANDIGDSTTADRLLGIRSLHDQYTIGELGEWTDIGATPFRDHVQITVVQDVVASTDEVYSRLYSNEIVDEYLRTGFFASDRFIGELNSPNNRTRLESAHETILSNMLDDGVLDSFTLNVRQNPDDAFEVIVETELDVSGLMDVIRLDVVVGNTVQLDE